MSSEQSNTATSEPAQVAQSPVETKGAANKRDSDFSRMIASKQIAPQAFSPKQENAPPAKAEASLATKAETTEEAEKAPNAEATTEEPKTTAETEQSADTTAGGDKEEAEEVLSPETHSLDPKLQAKIDRRIGKVTARAKAAEARIAELEAKIAAQVAPPAEDDNAEEKVVHVPANVPLAEIRTPAQLEELKMRARQEIRWTEQWLDEDANAEGKIQTDRGLATKKELREARRNAQIVMEDLIPQREQFLNSRQTAQQKAYEEFPFLKDPKHPGYQLAQQAKRENAAWLASMPNADWIVGMQVMGYLAHQAAKEAAAKNGKATATAPAKPKPQPTRGQSEIASDASPTRAPTGIFSQQALQSERAKITGGKKSYGAKDFAQLLLANQRFRNSQ